MVFNGLLLVLSVSVLMCWTIGRVSGYMMTDKLEVPRRKVKKNWYVGLDADPVDRSHPDVHDDQLILEAAERKSTSRKLLVG